MRLGIISDSFHYRDEKGQLYNLSVLRQQLECWANLFDELVICAPLLPGTPPVTHSPYEKTNIRLLPIAAAGGNGLKAKMQLLGQLPTWVRQLRQLLKQVDAVHIRCPNNISIPGLLLLERFSGYRQALFTGNWQGYEGEPPTYRWQRWFLRSRFRGPVAVYGDWPGEPAHIVPTFSPSYPRAIWEDENEQIQAKIERLRHLTALLQPVQLVSVGWLNENKNQQLIIQALSLLQAKGIDAELHLLGDGEKRQAWQGLAHELGVGNKTHFYGHASQEQVRHFYRQAHFVIQPSFTEGFTKVPVEAMFHGAVPLLSHINLNPQIVGNGTRGHTFSPTEPQTLVNCIEELAQKPADMVRLIEQGRLYAQQTTLEAWQDHIQAMLEKHWQVELTPAILAKG